MNPSTIDLQISPAAAELYAVIDVLVAVGFGLARRDGQVSSAAPGNARLTAEREALDIALCMVGEMVARESADPVDVPSAASMNGSGVAGNGFDTTPVARLLLRIGDKYFGK